METESSPDPDPQRRPEANPMRDVKAEPSLHSMPPFVNRHEPAVEGLQRRGHLMADETGHRFDQNNQPLATPPHPPAQNPEFKENVMKSNPNPPRFNDPSKT